MVNHVATPLYLMLQNASTCISARVHRFRTKWENVDKEKDLCVIVDQSLKFHTHTSAAVKKANQILGLIRKSFALLDEDTLPLLYTSMVRPHLEYGNVIWGPHFKGDMKSVERVQKRATKLIPKLRNLSYRERLQILDLPSLEHRRRRGDMMCYKILTNKANFQPGAISSKYWKTSLQPNSSDAKALAYEQSVTGMH